MATLLVASEVDQPPYFVWNITISLQENKFASTCTFILVPITTYVFVYSK